VSTPWSSLREALQHCLDRRLTFAAFRIAGQAVQLLVQRTAKVHHVGPTELDALQNVFVIAPFEHTRETLYVLQPDERVSFDANTGPVDLTFPESAPGEPYTPKALDGTLDQAAYACMVNEALMAIERGALRKVVLSRTKDVPLQAPDTADLFIRALSDLPSAFICLAHTPDHGTWLGASPERLLRRKGEQVEVDSIAGTMDASDAPDDPSQWGGKERDEQALVTQQVERVLGQCGVRSVDVHGPEVLRAGNVAHLHTRLSTSGTGLSLARLMLDLHPTPAVCGTPTDVAMTFLTAHEPHDRVLYAGAWGPWQADNGTELFVNIRCMQVFEQHVRLYVGGGITAGSEPGREWEETEHKAQTWERIIRAGQGRIT
jgi:isochorismate synthase